MLVLENVGKEFNLRPVLDDISFRFGPGHSYSLVAPNGSGKTTLLHIMAGLSRPTRGRVLWGDEPLRASHRRQLGVVLQQPLLFGDLTGYENLLFFARMHTCKEAGEKARSWLDVVGLNDVQDLKVKAYSKGMMQRLALARALIHEPQLLLLDEPFDGLDYRSTGLFMDLLQETIQRGTTLFLVTHRTEESQLARAHLTLRYGRLVQM
jgi:ABC-type multidrug transport system ATPase subunit